MGHKYKDSRELIGVEFKESGKTYKITGIGETTEEFMTLFTEKVKEEIINWNGKVLIDVGHGGTKTTSSGKKYRDYGAVNDKSKVDEFTWNHDFVMRYIIPELNASGIANKVVLRSTNITKLVQDLNKASGKDDIILSFIRNIINPLNNLRVNIGGEGCNHSDQVTWLIIIFFLRLFS